MRKEFDGANLRNIWLGFCATTIARLVVGLEGQSDTNLLIMVDLAIFAAYWLRFLLGNLNYLKATYTAAFVRSTAGQMRARYDLVLVVLHGFCFLFLAGRIGDCVRFTHALILLNLSDLFWLAYEPRVYPLDFRIWRLCRTCARNHGNGRFIDLAWVSEHWNYAPRYWMWSNLAAAAILTAGLFLGSERCVVLTAMVAVVGTCNSMFDIRKTGLRVKRK